MSQRGLPWCQEIVSSLILHPFSPSLHYWKGHAARHSGRLPVVQQGGGWWGDEFPRSASVDGFWLKPRLFHHSFHHPGAWTVLFYFPSLQESPLPWSVAVKVKTVRGDWDAETVMNEHIHCHSSSLRAIRPWRSHLVWIQTPSPPSLAWKCVICC